MRVTAEIELVYQRVLSINCLLVKIFGNLLRLAHEVVASYEFVH